MLFFFYFFSPNSLLHLAIKQQLFFSVLCFPFCLCDSAKIIRKLRGWKKTKWKEFNWVRYMCHPVWFCRRLRFSYTTVRVGVVRVASVTCRSKGEIARKDLFINFMVVALLVEGGKWCLWLLILQKRCWQFIISISGSAVLSSRFG